MSCSELFNSNDQKLIRDIHCYGYIFYHQSMIKIFVDFAGSYFIIFTLDSIHRMFQTKHLCIHYD